MNDSRLKTWIEVVALLLGIALGGVSLYHQIRPGTDLTGDLLQVAAPLPPEFEAELRGIPGAMHDEILKPPGEDQPRVPQPATVAPIVRDIAARRVSALFWPTTVSEEMLVCTVRNNGSQPLEAVQVAFKYWHAGKVLVQRPDGKKEAVDTSGLVDLGELRPGAEARIFGWGLITSLAVPGNVTLSHKAGRGVVRELRAVPAFVAQEGGMWFSYRIAFNVLVAAFLLLGAGLAIRRSYRAFRSRKGQAAVP